MPPRLQLPPLDAAHARALGDATRELLGARRNAVDGAGRVELGRCLLFADCWHVDADERRAGNELLGHAATEAPVAHQLQDRPVVEAARVGRHAGTSASARQYA